MDLVSSSFTSSMANASAALGSYIRGEHDGGQYGTINDHRTSSKESNGDI
jgi:hypothetical protein